MTFIVDGVGEETIGLAVAVAVVLRTAVAVGAALGAGLALGEGMPIADKGIGVGDGRASGA